MATGDKIFVPTQAEVANSTPVGTVAAFSIATAPSGFMECDGAAVSRTTYSALFAVIGESYGVGDGSTTFNIPDLRGEFIRGFDNGKGTDSGRTIASSQADAFKSHNHTTHYHNVNMSAGSLSGGTINGSGTSGSTGGTETRPRNIAMMYCIKY